MISLWQCLILRLILPTTYLMLERGQLFSWNISCIFFTIGNCKILALYMSEILADWKIWKRFSMLDFHEISSSWQIVIAAVGNLLMQWTAGVSSNRLRHTVQNFLLWCVGSDQQWATGFLMMQGAIPEQGVTTLVTHLSCTMKLQTDGKVKYAISIHFRRMYFPNSHEMMIAMVVWLLSYCHPQTHTVQPVDARPTHTYASKNLFFKHGEWRAAARSYSCRVNDSHQIYANFILTFAPSPAPIGMYF